MVCRWCGKKGFKKVKEIESSQNVIPDYMHEVCSFCKGRYIDKDTWDIWYKRGWTTKQKLKNKVQKILNLNDGSLSLNDITFIGFFSFELLGIFTSRNPDVSIFRKLFLFSQST